MDSPEACRARERMHHISRRRVVSTAASSAERQSVRLRRREKRGRHNVHLAHSQSTMREPSTKQTAHGHVPSENYGHQRADAHADTSSAAFAKQAAALRAAEADATALLLGRAAAFGALGLIPSRRDRSSSMYSFSFPRRAALPRQGRNGPDPCGLVQLPASSTASTTAQNSQIEVERPAEEAELYGSGHTALRTRGSSGAATARTPGASASPAPGASASPAPISLGNTATCPLAHGTGSGSGLHDSAHAAASELDQMESSSVPFKGKRPPIEAFPGGSPSHQASAPSERASERTSGSPAPDTPHNHHRSSAVEAGSAQEGSSTAAAQVAPARGGACDRDECRASKPCTGASAPEPACTVPGGLPADDVPEAASLTLTILQQQDQLDRARGEIEQYRARAEAAEGQLCSLRARAHAAEEEVRRARARTGELMLQVGRAQQQLLALHRQEEEGARREAGRGGAAPPSLRPIKVSFSPETRGGEGAGAGGTKEGDEDDGDDGDDDGDDWVQAAQREVARFLELKTPKASASSAISSAGRAAVASSVPVGGGVGVGVGAEVRVGQVS